MFVCKPALRHNRFHHQPTALLRDFYFVLRVWVPAYVLQRGRMGRVLEISGTAKNLETAGHVFGLIGGCAGKNGGGLRGTSAGVVPISGSG